MRKLHRLLELSPGDWLLLLQLSVLSLALRTALSFVPLPGLVRFLATCAKTTFLRQLPLLHKNSDWTRLAPLADLAARVTRGQGRCLVRSLLLFWLLKIRGEPAELLIGVSKESAVFQAHAWVETDGKILGDNSQATERFATLLRL